MTRALLAMLTACLLIACSEEAGQDSSGAAKDHVFKDQVKALDKAKDVNKAIEQAAQRQREAAEQQ